MDDTDTLRSLDRATTAMAATVAELDPGAPVPTCPGWDVTDLVDNVVEADASAAARAAGLA